MVLKKGEYKIRGEYHKQLDPNWSYYPIYIRKIKFVSSYIENFKGKEIKILDAGCGEGVLVEKFKKKGFDIVGIDKNFQSKYVRKGDIVKMPFRKNSFGVVLMLDVIEHLSPEDQIGALKEIYRVMKKEGEFIISVPNLAHKASRWNFFRNGELIRTANIQKHICDRPVKEYIGLFDDMNFKIKKRIPIQLTLPPFEERLLKTILGKKGFQKFIYSSKRNPDDCFLNIFILRKI